MGSDMIVALREASAHRTTLFALNHHTGTSLRHAIQVVPGQMHELGEVVHVGAATLPQARQTYCALGMQPIGQWGFTHGVNEHRVAIGVTDWQSRLQGSPSQLGGFDLVRLALQRSHGAHHAVEILTDLLQRHAHDQPEGNDHIFLIADPREAFVLETAGRFWAMLECGHTRVVTDASMIRQDWRRLAPGLADFVVAQGWWNDDGSKIDFGRCLAVKSEQSSQAHKRWGHASLALAQQQGAIDAHFLRRLLLDHYTKNRDFLPAAKNGALSSSFVVDLQPGDQPLVAWIAFGGPKAALYVPVCLSGELPAAFGERATPASTFQETAIEMQKLANGKDRAKVLSAIERLQTKYDQDAEDFVARAQDYSQHGKPYLIGQIATEMMHGHVELLEREYRRLVGLEVAGPHRIPAEEEEVLFFA